MFAYDLFVFSQAQLLSGVEPASWDARGLVVLLMVPLLALAARRNPLWSLNVFVSRHVVFYTTSFMVIGIYLLLMAGGGYLIRLYGGTWGRAAQLVFIAGAGVVLLALIASGSLRRRLKVFLNKHFFRNKYDYRVEWLRFIQTLSAPEEGVDARDSAVRAIAQIIGSPGGLLFLRTQDGESYKAAASWPPRAADVPREPPLEPNDEMMGFLARHQWVIDLRELESSTSCCRRSCVRAADIAWSCRSRTGTTSSAAWRSGSRRRRSIRTTRTVTCSRRSGATSRCTSPRQFEAYHRLTAFVMHDLKNLAAQLALIVSNAEKHKRNPEFVDDAISTIANSTERMQRLIEQLQRREVQATKRRVALAEIARRACERCAGRTPVPDCAAGAEQPWVEADPERLAMVVEHVIRNAQDATLEGGRVTVTVGIDGSESAADAAPAETSNRLRVPAATLTVTDTGAGMTREFIQERLFKPFDTTKGSKGMGIGAYQVREYLQSLGGRVDVTSEVGRGTRFTLRIPLAIPQD